MNVCMPLHICVCVRTTSRRNRYLAGFTFSRLSSRSLLQFVRGGLLLTAMLVPSTLIRVLRIVSGFWGIRLGKNETNQVRKKKKKNKKSSLLMTPVVWTGYRGFATWHLSRNALNHIRDLKARDSNLEFRSLIAPNQLDNFHLSFS